MILYLRRMGCRWLFTTVYVQFKIAFDDLQACSMHFIAKYETLQRLTFKKINLKTAIII